MADGLRQDLPVSYIYTLSDPRDGCVRYVGKSVDPLQRFRDHLRFSKTERTYKANWIKQLASLGLVPVHTVVDEAPIAMIDALEREWIARLRTEGVDLTNGTAGGDGWEPGHHHTDETKQKMRKPKSPAHAAAISKAKTGSKHHLAKLVEAQVIEIKRLLQEGTLRHREIASRYGVSRTAISLISNRTTWRHIDG